MAHIFRASGNSQSGGRLIFGDFSQCLPCIYIFLTILIHVLYKNCNIICVFCRLVFIAPGCATGKVYRNSAGV